MSKKTWSKRNVEEHIRANWDSDYGLAVVAAALFKKLYGVLPSIGMSGFQAEAADEVVKKLPDTI